MQLIGLVGIVSALLVASDRITFRGPGVYVAGFALLLAALWLRGINRGIQRIGEHLIGIEKRINTLACEAWGAPKEVLTWEAEVRAGKLQVRGLAGWVGRLGGYHDRR
ncbi:hypothetical protein [Streptomyces sp. C36]|uniref:hypothetical protein n=1 Tax=Streptomyces sp. C36 TaxID=3237122 RepID=UPI0034C6531A